MLFNSLVFCVFLPLTFAGYWLICYPHGNHEVSPLRLWLQNLFIVVASYVFYGWWDWRFLLLITLTAVWSWISGLHLASLDNIRKRKIVVAAALIVNLGILGVFKYYNFFAENAAALLGMLGFKAHMSTLNIILPVGISFYTFQALSYVIDVYRKDIEPTKDLIAFLAFVSFFPQLVAGPIERATNLLPQFLKARHFDYALAVDGCRQMLWGFFKKILVADTCAFAANILLGNVAASSISLWAGVICFSFQIYGDFSGYSDIAIGCAKLFGIKLMRNFNTPYFSRDIAEFWRRWHISLTTWFRDYLYIPLGGSRCGLLKKMRNTFAIFLVSGFWHGANWTFIAWGGFHAICFLPLLIRGKNRTYISNVVAEGRNIPSLRETGQMLATFILAVIGWTFFRAPDISTAVIWLSKMLSFSDCTVRQLGLGNINYRLLVPLSAMIVLEWFNRGKNIPSLPKKAIFRWAIYCMFAFAIILWQSRPQSFIYFQF